MRSVSVIQNQRSIEWGLDLKEAYLFSWVYEISSWAKRIIIGNDVYYFCAKSKIISELPLLSDKPDTIYRYLKSLSEKGLISLKKVDGNDYIFITEKGSTWNEKSNQSEYSEKNPSRLGKISELSSEKFPTYNIYSILHIDNITKDNIPDFLKKSEKSLNSHLKSEFLAKYKKELLTEAYFTAKDAGKLKGIIQKIIFKMKEKSKKELFTFEEIQGAISFFLQESWSVMSDYEKSNYSLTILDSKFNEIFVKIKNKSDGKPAINNTRYTGFKFDVPDPREGKNFSSNF